MITSPKSPNVEYFGSRELSFEQNLDRYLYRDFANKEPSLDQQTILEDPDRLSGAIQIPEGTWSV
jgi:hypothetical protein